MTTLMEPRKREGKPVVPGAAAGGVSDRLSLPLERVAGRARSFAVMRAILQVLVLIALVWLVAGLTLGSFRRVPVLAAVALALAAWGLIGWVLLRVLRRVGGRRDLSGAARLADAAMPDNQERISSAVEISQDPDGRFRGSPELVAVLFRQAEKAADRMDAAQVVSSRDVSRWFAILFPVGLAWLIVLVVAGPRIAVGLKRGLLPWTASQALPGPELVVTPGDSTVAQGESVEVDVEVKASAVELTPADQPVDRAVLVWQDDSGGAAALQRPLEMERTGPRSFRMAFDNLQAGFTYRIQAAGETAGPFSVHVQSRPAVARLRVDYTYPGYTHLAPRVDESRDGAIDALVGTQVKLTLDLSEPVKDAQVVLGTGAAAAPLALTKLSDTPPRYSTEMTLSKNDVYRIRLVGDPDLSNKDDQERPITARPDAPPLIAVTSVGGMPPAALKVRPDDVVAVKFTASDDFGLTKLEGLAQVDDSLPTVVRLPLTLEERKQEGTWRVAMGELLRILPPGANPQHVVLQIRATDNRDPDPQVTTSPGLELAIDAGVTPLAQRQDNQAAKELGAAVREAEQALEQARQAEAAVQAAGDKPLSAAEKQTAAVAQQQLADARQKLNDAAAAAAGTRLAEQAKEVQSIAQGPLKQGEENAAKASLAADQPAARNSSAADSQKSIAEAQSRLNKVAQSLGEQVKDQPLAHALDDLAKRQQELADALAAHPHDPALEAQQKQLQKELEKVIKEHPELQQTAAAGKQQGVDALAQQVRQLAESQDAVNDAVRSRADAAKGGGQGGDLAKQQQALNRDIGQFAQQQGSALRGADTLTPDDKALAPIVKDLADNHLEDAAAAQKRAAEQLDQAAGKLDRSGGANAAAKQAAALQQQLQKLSQEIQQAQTNHNPPTRPSDPANQTARALAEDVKRAAQGLAQHPAARAGAAAASKAADAARTAASQGNAKGAQQELSNAASRLAEAARAAGGSPEAGEAADEAKSLAQRQGALAEQTAAQAAAAADARSAAAHPSEAAKTQQEHASQIDQAAQQAESLQQGSQGAAPDLAAKIGKAAQALKSAAQEERAAAAATGANDPATAASRQQRSADALGQAEEALTGQRTPRPQGSPQQQDSQGGSSQQQARGQPAGQPGGKPGEQARGPSASGAGKQPGDSGQQGKGASQQTASGAGQPGEGQPGEGQPGAGQPGAGQPGGSASGGNAPGGAEGATADAGNDPAGLARAVQAAREAQSRAGDGNPAAAREAARQLAQAAQALSPSGGSSGPSSAMAGSTPPGGGTAGQPGVLPANGRGNDGSGRGPGVGPATPAAAADVPQAVQDIGVAPSDWAKLPAAMQDQLLHAAQQGGPPSYRDMIKNYYNRIARLQAENGTP